MPRNVAIRTSYQADAAYLTRLAHAIELDPKRDPEWKVDAIRLCNLLVQRLTSALLADVTQRAATGSQKK